MTAQGWKVVTNSPFKGGYITRHYATRAGVSTLQIEMRQGVYMNEQKPDKVPMDENFLPAVFGLQRALSAALDAFRADSR
jgi:formiminoglutamase